MAKSAERIRACALRREGKSIKEVAAELEVSRGSVSVWVRSIPLTKKQREFLTSRQIASGHKGRMLGTEVHRARKERAIKDAQAEAAERIKELSKGNLFYAGLGLYWGEGNKRGQVTITNSDPRVIQLVIRWFSECFDIGIDRLVPRIYISDVHRNREHKLMQYWSKTLHIPKKHFRRTVFLPKGKKLYENHDVYYGVMALSVARSTDIRYKVLAYIERLGQLVPPHAGVVQGLERGTHKP